MSSMTVSNVHASGVGVATTRLQASTAPLDPLPKQGCAYTTRDGLKLTLPGAESTARKLRQQVRLNLLADGWADKLGGESSPGRRWQLVFTTGTKQVQDALKGGKGGGSYFPLIAAQRWDTPKEEIENGVYLGHIASISFLGPWQMKSRKMTFDFKRINIKLGPWKFGFDLKAGQFGTKKDPEEGAKEKDGPFFLFIHVDDKVCVARGRGGGLAMWGRTSPVWEAKAGLIQA